MRSLFLVMAAVLSGGCRDHDDSSLTISFADDFSGAFPGAGWTFVETAGSGSIEVPVGNPAPSLVLRSVPPGEYRIRSTTSFFTDSSIVSIAVRHDGGPGSVTIDIAKPFVGSFASAVIGETGVDFRMPGRLISVPSDTAWHTFVFRVTYFPTFAEWLMDGFARQSMDDFPEPMGNHSGVFLELGVTGGAAAHVDNVSIQVPYP